MNKSGCVTSLHTDPHQSFHELGVLINMQMSPTPTHPTDSGLLQNVIT